jgi:hypothetical protein
MVKNILPNPGRVSPGLGFSHSAAPPFDSSINNSLKNCTQQNRVLAARTLKASSIRQQSKMATSTREREVKERRHKARKQKIAADAAKNFRISQNRGELYGLTVQAKHTNATLRKRASDTWNGSGWTNGQIQHLSKLTKSSSAPENLQTLNSLVGSSSMKDLVKLRREVDDWRKIFVERDEAVTLEDARAKEVKAEQAKLLFERNKNSYIEKQHREVEARRQELAQRKVVDSEYQNFLSDEAQRAHRNRQTQLTMKAIREEQMRERLERDRAEYLQEKAHQSEILAACRANEQMERRQQEKRR